MRTSLRDYFHALNVLNVETDVYVDGADDGCAVVAPIKLTPKGEKEWGGLLDNKDLYVDVEEYGNCIMSDNVQARELNNEGVYIRVKNSNEKLNSQELFYDMAYEQSQGTAMLYGK